VPSKDNQAVLIDAAFLLADLPGYSTALERRSASAVALTAAIAPRENPRHRDLTTFNAALLCYRFSLRQHLKPTGAETPPPWTTLICSLFVGCHNL
jgi:hypothetical protein